MLTVLTLVMLSLLLPVSCSRATVGAAALRSTSTWPVVLAVALAAKPVLPVTDTLMP